MYQFLVAIMLSMYHIAGNLMPDISKVLEELDQSEVGVVVAVIIHNHSGYKLILEDVDVSCGMFSNNGSMPEVLNPGGAYVIFSEKVREFSFHFGYNILEMWLELKSNILFQQ